MMKFERNGEDRDADRTHAWTALLSADNESFHDKQGIPGFGERSLRRGGGLWMERRNLLAEGVVVCGWKGGNLLAEGLVKNGFGVDSTRNHRKWERAYLNCSSAWGDTGSCSAILGMTPGPSFRLEIGEAWAGGSQGEMFEGCGQVAELPDGNL